MKTKQTLRDDYRELAEILFSRQMISVGVLFVIAGVVGVVYPMPDSIFGGVFAVVFYWTWQFCFSAAARAKERQRAGFEKR